MTPKRSVPSSNGNHSRWPRASANEDLRIEVVLKARPATVPATESGAAS
jgi:hypothetical protein